MSKKKKKKDMWVPPPPLPVPRESEERAHYQESIRIACSALYIVLNTCEEDQMQARHYAQNMLESVVENNPWLKVSLSGQNLVH